MVHGLRVFLMLPVVASNFLYLRTLALRWIGLSVALIFLSACAAPLAVLSSSGTSAASAVGTAAVANPGTAASLASTAATGKSPLEHAASAATKQDCNFLNALGPKPICSDIPVPAIKDMSEPYPGPADSLPTSK